jgi:hypothetical protein
MKLVETLVVRDEDADVVAAHVAFQLEAGVDAVLAGVLGGASAAAEPLDPFVRAGRVTVVPLADDAPEALVQRAAAEHGADWVLPAEADELWWPRGESLKDALAPIPARYGVLQGLVRLFVPVPGAGPFWERMTRRRSLEPPAEPEPLEWALRPLYRADPGLASRRARPGAKGRVPLRAWYPFEVLRFPLRGAEQAERRAGSGRPPRSTLEAEAVRAAHEGRLRERLQQLASEDGLVEDLRARDALRALAADGDPGGGASRLVFAAPGLVDDAAYAVECAALGEVDLPRLERSMAELEARIGWLEQRLWPRLLRRAARLVRR